MEKTTTEFISNPDKDETVVVHTSDFGDMLDRVTALRNEGLHGSNEMKLVAVIPGIVVEQYCFLNKVDWAEFWSDPKHIKALCNDPDNAYWRVAPGRV
jgi:hypothetical protein